jgi:tetratricopeptide (TPR) repeat protein
MVCLAQGTLYAQEAPAEKAETARLPALGEQLVYQEKLGRAAAEVAKSATPLCAAIEELQGSKTLDVRRCLAASEGAILLGTPQLTMGLMDRLIRECPNEKVPGMKLPVSVVGNLRIGTAGRYSGQSARALAAYQAAIAAADGMRGPDDLKTGVRAVAMIYIAEIMVGQGRSQEAVDMLGRVAQLAPVRGMPPALYKQWAEAEIIAIGSTRTELSTRAMEPLPAMLLLAHLSLAGFDDIAELDRHAGTDVVGPRLLEMASHSGVSRTDACLARLYRAETHARAGRYDEAFKLYEYVMHEPGFFGLDGAAGMLSCLKAQKKNREAEELAARMLARFPKAASTLEKTVGVPAHQ